MTEMTSHAIDGCINSGGLMNRYLLDREADRCMTS